MKSATGGGISVFFVKILKVQIGNMYEILILEDILAIREARSTIFLMKSDNVFKAGNEFRLAIIKDIEKQIHSEVLSLYPEVNSSPFKSELKSKNVY
ncbi:hypothetical protein P700755_004027 [Psychroflexus torquis ATCC 700755]|uniref:Uncharacterized protein n=1 Tax=Psychroflexus torquis (strain ATCC 700755 / CIP 106069 / ACAM 623) TaxID=313595 RepID=K4IJ59_PSYTT|nr:hypothetical protein [Psychroflexus torquis]AFU70582.1 hypothetical protein P700755_004027 [Psychroflexus torquis ATCC 700755]